MGHTHTETDLPIENEYPKLVRDGIPELVKSQGRHVETRTLDDDSELLRHLLEKLIEESTELVEAVSLEHQKEELADVREVLDTIESVLGIKKEEIEQVQQSKAEERGRFNDRILMLSKPS